ncbi:O-antigen ligase family protein [Tsuneonella mangrovi]|uniref:O-antigen ligase family protein n=1 Tax=Tsuneonella mangrovi TaxID=1982042 RepID=UPI000BA2AA6D|nr:O-antigen ligase family protein [Tsuneonella mangrovi]
MTARSLSWRPSPLAWFTGLGLGAQLGIVFGLVMPLVSAMLFPTWVHTMPLKWEERARLLELHFVFSEIVVVAIAYRLGMDRDAMWRMLPRDIRRATVVLLAAMFTSSTFLAKYPSDALLQSIITVAHLYFAIAVFYLARLRPSDDWDDLLRWLAGGLIVFAFLTWWKFSFPPPPTSVPGGAIEWSFALPGYISVRYLGTWTGAIAAGLVVRLLYSADTNRLTAWHLLYLFAAAFTVWTGTRAAILGMCGAVGLFAVLKPGLPARRHVGIVALLTAIAVLLAWIFRFDDPVFWLFNLVDVSSVSRFVNRTVLWHATIVRWLDSPWLGWGTGSVFFEVFIGWSHTQPHNAFLQFLFSWGIVGAIPACWILGRAVVSAHRSAMKDRARWPLLAIVYALLWMSMVDGALYYPRFVIMIVAGLAMLIAADRPSELA